MLCPVQFYSCNVILLSLKCFKCLSFFLNHAFKHPPSIFVWFLGYLQENIRLKFISVSTLMVYFSFCIYKIWMYCESKFTQYFLDRSFYCIWELYCCIKNIIKRLQTFIFSRTIIFFYASGFVYAQTTYICSQQPLCGKCAFVEGLLVVVGAHGQTKHTHVLSQQQFSRITGTHELSDLREGLAQGKFTPSKASTDRVRSVFITDSKTGFHFFELVIFALDKMTFCLTLLWEICISPT